MKITIDVDTQAQIARVNAGGAVYHIRTGPTLNGRPSFEITNPVGSKSTSKSLPEAIEYLLHKAFRLAKQPRSYSLGDEAGIGIALASFVEIEQ